MFSGLHSYLIPKRGPVFLIKVVVRTQFLVVIGLTFPEALAGALLTEDMGLNLQSGYSRTNFLLKSQLLTLLSFFNLNYFCRPCIENP